MRRIVSIVSLFAAAAVLTYAFRTDPGSATAAAQGDGPRDAPPADRNGDIDGDGNIDMNDLMALLDFLVGQGVPPAVLQGPAMGQRLVAFAELLEVDSTSVTFNTNRFNLKGEQPHIAAVLRASETGIDGADLRLRDAAGRTTVDLDTQEINGGAVIRLEDGSAVETVRVDANEEGGGGYVILRNGAGTLTVEVDADEGDAPVLRLFGPDGTETAALRGSETGSDGADLRLRDASGQVTIDIDAQQTNGGGAIFLNNDAGQETVKIDGDQGDAAVVELSRADGTTGILLDADHPLGGSLVRTQILSITGGSDVAEPFDIVDAEGQVDQEVEPGTVVVIDSNRPGSLTPSTEPYDRRVAGVVSGAGGVRPGLLMAQEGSIANGSHPVAISGRVFVKADATWGAIEPGDLLTTSPTPGHAQRVSQPERSYGAVLGKAMTRLSEGKGLVLVLVGLQ